MIHHFECINCKQPIFETKREFDQGHYFWPKDRWLHVKGDAVYCENGGTPQLRAERKLPF